MKKDRTIYQQLVDDLKCSFCLTVLVQPMITECGHLFCNKCILDRLRNKPVCPICNAYMAESNVLPAPASISSILLKLDKIKNNPDHPYNRIRKSLEVEIVTIQDEANTLMTQAKSATDGKKTVKPQILFGENLFSNPSTTNRTPLYSINRPHNSNTQSTTDRQNRLINACESVINSQRKQKSTSRQTPTNPVNPLTFRPVNGLSNSNITTTNRSTLIAPSTVANSFINHDINTVKHASLSKKRPAISNANVNDQLNQSQIVRNDSKRFRSTRQINGSKITSTPMINQNQSKPLNTQSNLFLIKPQNTTIQNTSAKTNPVTEKPSNVNLFSLALSPIPSENRIESVADHNRSEISTPLLWL